MARRASKNCKRVWICNRIELNALTSPQLIEYIERGLGRHDATRKLVPDAATIRTDAMAQARDATRRALDWMLSSITERRPPSRQPSPP